MTAPAPPGLFDDATEAAAQQPAAAAIGVGTATGPTLAQVARRARWPLLGLAALLVVGVLTGLLAAGTPSGRLDPDSFSPDGSRAVAQVLRDQGVPVTRVEDVPSLLSRADDDTTVVISRPELLVASELAALGEAPGGLVVVGALPDAVDALGLDVEVSPPVDVAARRPACDLAAAARAGDADLGGLRYAATGDTASTGCYAVGGVASLLRLTERQATLLGDGTPLTNDKVGDRGNAALVLGLLGERPGGVLWLVPRSDRPLPADERGSLADLVPDGVYLGALQLLLALGVLALVRARRLGRVVEEPLPVVVRAAEAVEGRGRLYRLADARGTAAESLRAATRDRLGRRVGVSRASNREALVGVVAARTGVEAAVVEALLYGEAPADDAALTRLAAELRQLQATLGATP